MGSQSGWALGAIAPWCLGTALAVSISADAGQEASFGASLAPLAVRVSPPPAAIGPPGSFAPAPGVEGFAEEARRAWRMASLSVGGREEFTRLPDEIEPRAVLKRNVKFFPEIDRSHKGDPLTGLRPGFDSRLRNPLGLASLRSGALLLPPSGMGLAGSFFAPADKLPAQEKASMLHPWLDGERPLTAPSSAAASPSEASSAITLRLAALNERVSQGATPAVPQAAAIASATPAAPSLTPFEAVVLPGGPPAFAAMGGGTEVARANIAALMDEEAQKREARCLAEAIYFEARGESAEGQAAVAQTVLNRAASGLYPSTICSVVYQSREHDKGCQFSFACSGAPLRITESGAWRRAQQIAADVVKGTAYVPDIGSSTHFHAAYVRPRWARRLEKMDVIGHHIFYKLRPGQS
ncbi:MAG TPA: cell wall hydrolase [Methylocella sp.]|nr:cell wall hydrolase [Methylocella sp.]